MEGNSGGVGGGGAVAGVGAGGATTVGGGAGGGGNDVELLCKTLQVEHKLFYFDLKENPRGRYLKISEKTSATRSTIIVPFSGISWFLDLFNYYVNSDDQDVFSKELQLDTKVSSSKLFIPPLRLLPPPASCFPSFLSLLNYLLRSSTLTLARTAGAVSWRFFLSFFFFKYLLSPLFSVFYLLTYAYICCC